MGKEQQSSRPGKRGKLCLRGGKAGVTVKNIVVGKKLGQGTREYERRPIERGPLFEDLAGKKKGSTAKPRCAWNGGRRNQQTIVKSH